MKTKILRAYLQGWEQNKTPLDYLINKGFNIVKYTYSNFAGCFFFEVESVGLENIKQMDVLEINPSKFNWNV